MTGSFEFVVPYATQGTPYDTAPIGPYRLTIDGITRDVHVSEDDVMNGKTIWVDLV